MKQPPLIAVGVVLLAIGLAIFGVLALGKPGALEPDASPAARAGEPTDHANESGEPSRAWALLGGVTLACGAACVGIGMNRWRSQPTA